MEFISTICWVEAELHAAQKGTSLWHLCLASEASGEQVSPNLSFELNLSDFSSHPTAAISSQGPKGSASADLVVRPYRMG